MPTSDRLLDRLVAAVLAALLAAAGAYLEQRQTTTTEDLRAVQRYLAREACR